MSRFRHPLGSLLIVPLLAVSLTQADAQAQSPTNVRIAIQPLTNFTPALIARDKGWFAEENLNVTWTMISQAAVAIEAVFGGSSEFGGAAILEPIVARGNGLDISFVVANTKIRNEPPDNNGLLVLADSNIRTAQDLVGKTVSAGLINSINYIHMQEWLTKHGVDPRTVKFLELPFPQMADALFQKRIDAVWNVEPFVTVMLQTGKARVIAHPYQEVTPGMDVTAFFAKDTWLKANRDTALRFKRAMERATAYLRDAPKEERDTWISKYSGVKTEVVAAMNLPQFSTAFDVPSLARNLEIAVRHKVVKPFDVNTMIWKP
jgi:NitT/TauT family transport system substrate-binding protein